MFSRTLITSTLRGQRLRSSRAVIPRRTFFGLGGNKDSSAIAPAATEQTLRDFQTALQGKPQLLQALKNFAALLENEGISVSSGKMPGPLQLMKLAKNPQFLQSYGQLEAELKSAGIDVRSKEFLKVAQQMMNSKSGSQ
ncbi:unnamed protein product [Mycena citricolor]|uniref:Uncharacterized protein n=1 Tax=Mycena citricolor TaxID=2018698 RepID=A0AAD2HJC0_9AGAR|nr:unnamed protein product [Mycena citricolor]